MELIREEKNSHIQIVKNPPYTIFGNSGFAPQHFRICFEGDGLKEIIKHMRPHEDLIVTVYAGNKASKFEISDTHRHYEGVKK